MSADSIWEQRHKVEEEILRFDTLLSFGGDPFYVESWERVKARNLCGTVYYDKPKRVSLKDKIINWIDNAN